MLFVAIKHEIFAATRMNTVFNLGNKIVEFVGMKPGAVYDADGFKSAPITAPDLPTAARNTLKIDDLCIEHESHTVRRRILGCTEGQLIGTAYAAGRSPKGRNRLLGNVRFTGAKLFLPDDLHRHSIFSCTRLEVLERLRLLFRKRKH